MYYSWERWHPDELDAERLAHGRVEEVPRKDHDDLVPRVGQNLQADHQRAKSPVRQDAVLGIHLAPDSIEHIHWESFIGQPIIGQNNL